MLFKVIQCYKLGAESLVYESVEACGRMFPAMRRFIDSWISTDLSTRYQLMEGEDEYAFGRGGS